MASQAMLDLVVDLKGDAEQQLGGVAGALGKLGLAGIGIGQIKDVVGGAISAFGDLAQAGADEKLGFDRLVATVKNSIPAWDGNTQALDAVIAAGEAKAFQDDQVRESLGLLVGKYKDVTKAQEVQSLAMDLARAKGLSLEEATKLLIGSSSRQASALAKLGIQIDKSGTEAERFGAIQVAVAGQAELFADSSAGAAERTAEAFQNAKEDIGQAILPLQQAVLGGFAAFLQSDAFQGIIQRVTDLLGVAVPAAINLVNSAITTALGVWSSLQPVIQPIVDFISANLMPVMIGMATALLTVVVPAFVAWASAAGAAALATIAALAPVLIPLAAIAAGVALLVAAWNNDFGGIQTTVTAFWEGTLKPILDQIIQFFTTNIPAALTVLQGVWDGIWGAIQAAVIPILTTIFVELAKFWLEIQPKLAEVWANIQTIIQTVWGIIGSIITAAMPIIQGVIEHGLKFISDLWNAVWPGIQSVLTGVWDVIKGVVQVAWGFVSGIISAGLSLLQGDWAGAWKAIQEALNTVWEGIKSIVSGAWEILSGLISAGLGALKTIWDTAWNAISQTVTDIWNNITRWVGEQIDAVKARIDLVTGAIKLLWQQFWDGVGTTLSNAWAGIVNTVSTKLAELQGFLSSFPGKIAGAVASIGSSIVSGIQAGMAGAWQGFLNWVSGLMSGLPDVVKQFLGIHSPSQVMAEEVGAPIVAGIGEGMQAGWSAVLSGAQNLTTSLVVLFANQFDPQNDKGVAFAFEQGWRNIALWFRYTWSVGFANVLNITMTELRLVIQGQAAGFNQAGHMLGDAVIQGMVAALNAGAASVAGAVPLGAGAGAGGGKATPYVPPTGTPPPSYRAPNQIGQSAGSMSMGASTFNIFINGLQVPADSVRVEVGTLDLARQRGRV